MSMWIIQKQRLLELAESMRASGRDSDFQLLCEVVSDGQTKADTLFQQGCRLSALEAQAEHLSRELEKYQGGEAAQVWLQVAQAACKKVRDSYPEDLFKDEASRVARMTARNCSLAIAHEFAEEVARASAS